MTLEMKLPLVKPRKATVVASSRDNAAPQKVSR